MQKICVFGLDYKSSSFDLRGKFAFSREEIPLVLKRLQDSGVLIEAVILSTCNRTEVYCVTADIDFVINAVCDIQNICPRKIIQSIYIYKDIECVRHLFSVASGLQSMVLGETEIVAQIKVAILIARESGTVGSFLSGVFHMALNVSKEVRYKSKITEIALSMGNACLNLVTEYILQNSNIDNFIQPKILFIGAGQMMQQVASHFSKMDFAQKSIINRTFSTAENLAKIVNAEALAFERLADVVSEYSVIIACCDSPTILLDKNILSESIDNQRNLLIIDLSMPLVVDIKLNLKYDNVTVVTIDDIAKIVDVGVSNRKLAANKAESVITKKLDEYQSWLKKRSLSPLIRALRENAELIRHDALLIAVKELENGVDAKIVLESLSVRLTNKLIHAPTVNLCVANDDDMRDNLFSLVNHLYDLNVSE